MIDDIKTFHTLQEAKNTPLGETQLAISQATGDYLDMYESILIVKEHEKIIGYNKVVAMFEPNDSWLRSLIFSNGYGRHFVTKEESDDIELIKIRKIEYKEEE